MIIIGVGIHIGLEQVSRMPAKIDIMKIGDLVSEVGLASLYESLGIEENGIVTIGVDLASVLAIKVDTMPPE